MSFRHLLWSLVTRTSIVFAWGGVFFTFLDVIKREQANGMSISVPYHINYIIISLKCKLLSSEMYQYLFSRCNQ
jgi:hypothetical protein